MGVFQAVPHRPQIGIGGVGGQIRGGVEIAGADRFETLVQCVGTGLAFELPPPERPLEDHDERRDQTEQDRPHDRATPQEEVQDQIGKHWIHDQRLSSNRMATS